MSLPNPPPPPPSLPAVGARDVVRRCRRVRPSRLATSRRSITVVSESEPEGAWRGCGRRLGSDGARLDPEPEDDPELEPELESLELPESSLSLSLPEPLEEPLEEEGEESLVMCSMRGECG